MTNMIEKAARAEHVPAKLAAMRDMVARAFDDRWPFFMPGPKTIDGHRTCRRFDWDSAPAFHQNECYEKADVALTALYGSTYREFLDTILSGSGEGDG